MPLPQRAFWTAIEAAARLNCSAAHLIGLAHQNHFKLSVGISYALAFERRIAGLVHVAPADLLPLAAPCAQSPHHVHRVQIPGDDEWLFIDQPTEGLPVRLSDLLISDDELAHFEARHNIGGARYVTPPMTAEKYEWPDFYAAVVRRIHEEGVPETQRALAQEMQEWFITRSADGEAPDLRTISKRLTPIWRALQAQAEA